MANYERPVSPHIQIYRWRYTFFAFSILHRATGLLLTAGTVLLVYWLVAASQGQEKYSQAQAVFAHPITQLALVLWLWSFWYHLLNGVRHLVWDTGHGLERRTARSSGWFVFILSVVLTLATWAIVLMRVSAGVPAGGLI